MIRRIGQQNLVMRTKLEPNFRDCRRYLLGSMRDDEQVSIEESLLCDGDFLEMVLAAEGELVDDYVAGALTENEEAGFVQYLSRLPECEQKVQFARALSEAITQPGQLSKPTGSRVARPRWLWSGSRLLATAALVVVLIGGVWAQLMISTLRRDADAVRAELQGARARLSVLETARETAVFVLTSGTLRGAGVGSVEPLTLPKVEPLIEFQLDLGVDDYPSYRAAIFDAEAIELLSLSGLATQTTAERILVPLTVPAELVDPGDYFIVLAGIPRGGVPEPVARYSFRFRRN